MTRNHTLLTILNFGRNEEHRLIKEGKAHEAYQIEHARKELICFFDVHTIDELKRRLNTMINYSCAGNGPLIYVHDDFTRNLLKDLKRVLD